MCSDRSGFSIVYELEEHFLRALNPLDRIVLNFVKGSILISCSVNKLVQFQQKKCH